MIKGEQPTCGFTPTEDLWPYLSEAVDGIREGWSEKFLHPEVLEEALQTAIRTTLRRVKDGEFEPDEDAAVVLASCLHHAFCEKLKRRRRTERPLLTDPPAGGLSPEGALIASERDEEGEILDQIEKRVFEDCLREMRAYFSTKSQFAVLLALLRNVYQVEPLTIEQIAERTGMSTRTVDRLSHRFRVLWPEKVEKARNELAWYVTRSREDT